MITKTHKGELGLRLPEKSKKKVAREPEARCLVLNSNSYLTEVCPTTATSSTKSAARGQAPETPPVKKKRKKKDCSVPHGEDLVPGAPVCARWAETSPRPRAQALGPAESVSGEKKKKKKSLCPLAVSPSVRVKTSLDPKQVEEVTRVGKKLRKHKKERKAREAAACPARDPWLCEAGDVPGACSVAGDDQEQAALGRKRKQGCPREHSAKIKRKKKTRQERESPLDHPQPRPVEGGPGKGSKKKPVKVEASEYIPIGGGLERPAKKKVKSSKRAEAPGTEDPTLPRKKKKRKESKAAGLWEEEPDPDLEVVLEKKGNMDEAHIDQVRRKALQEEIDRESGKTETSETRKWTGTQFGQWDTAGFENEEQKLKFLKLMGGFKNLSPSFSRTPDTTGRPNMALGRKAAATLQQSLQQDYDRAMSWKYSRGAGLGFSATPNKVFYIDRNASKSIKFED